MKRYLYIFLAAALTFVGCSQSDFDSSLGGEQIPVAGEGEVVMAFDVELQGAKSQTINTRAGSAWAQKENVTNISGWAFVFSTDPAAEDGYGDNSILLQKVEFKSTEIAGKTTIYVTLDEYAEPCYVRLMTSLTQYVSDQMDEFVSQKDIDGGAAGTVTTLAEYKHISVNLAGYYADPTAPNPANLTPNGAFPLASPGIDMPNGLTEDTIADVDPTLYMVPTASKVDVTTACAFDLKAVTLLNGACKARMRSTVLENDGVTVMHSLPLPINLGGVVEYQAVIAQGGTTAATPIYFFPNEGDGPFDDPLDAAEEDYTNLSDEINTKNPTYLIVKGRAAGYSVDGYYKIPIVYKVEILGENGLPTGEYSEPTYDILRNYHYKVMLNKVDNPGYASYEEAVAGPANDIAYDIMIDGSSSNTEDTFSDPRAETITSHNGFFYVELVGSEIFAQGYGTQGVSGEFGLSLTRNVEVDPSYDIPTLYITGSDGITIKNNSTVEADNFANLIKFTATKSGTITLRCGDMLKEIPVHYASTPHVWQSGATIGGAALSAVAEFAADDSAVANDTAMIANNGSIAENTTYENREFRGKVYPSDMSNGIRKVYCKQASNFGISTYYNNSAESATGGNSASNNIFKATSTSVMNNVYEADINYQSTGKVYQVNSVNQGTLKSKIMNKWWIGEAPISFTARGKFTSSFSGSISSTFTSDSWSSITDNSEVVLDAGDIGNNQIGSTYDATRAKITNSATLTLTNIAGQTNTYNFVLNQSAAPYIKGLTLVDGIYQYNCPTAADCSGGYFSSNKGNTIGTTPKVYNAHYQGGGAAWPNGADWVWSEAEKEGDYIGGSTGVTKLDAGTNVAAVPDNNPNATEYYFNVKVKSSGASYDKNNYQAYFDLRLTNDANELIFLRIRIRRDDDSQ